METGITVVGSWIVCTVASLLIGYGKGKGGMGLLWGALLGPVGVLIMLGYSDHKMLLTTAQLRKEIKDLREQVQKLSPPPEQSRLEEKPPQ